jgi:hypothetical protein
MQSEQINELATALAEAQGEFPVIGKAQTAKLGSYSYRYADLSDLLSAVRPVLAKHGLAVSQPLQSGAALILETILLHKSGQWLSSAYQVERHDKPQEQGSAITYARRYALAALLGIAAEEDDDDGKAAQEAKPAAPTPKPTPAVVGPFPVDTAQTHKLPPREPQEQGAAGDVPTCPKCGLREKVIRSKYAGPTWRCLECKQSFGPTNAIKATK